MKTKNNKRVMVRKPLVTKSMKVDGYAFLKVKKHLSTSPHTFNKILNEFVKKCEDKSYLNEFIKTNLV